MPRFHIVNSDTTKLNLINGGLGAWFQNVLNRATALSSHRANNSTLFVSQIWRPVFKDIKKLYATNQYTDAQIDGYLEQVISKREMSSVRVMLNMTNSLDFAQADPDLKTIHINKDWFAEIGKLLALPMSPAVRALLNMHMVLLIFKLWYAYTHLLTPFIMLKISEIAQVRDVVEMETPVKIGTKKVRQENGKIKLCGDMGFAFEQECLFSYRLHTFHSGQNVFDLTDLLFCTEDQVGYAYPANFRDPWVNGVLTRNLAQVTDIMTVLQLPIVARGVQTRMTEELGGVIVSAATCRTIGQKRKKAEGSMLEGGVEELDDEPDSMFISRYLAGGMKS